jgi:hypothetical protein
MEGADEAVFVREKETSDAGRTQLRPGNSQSE